jgi:predicted transposase/invertase (TIGR01784 family)
VKYSGDCKKRERSGTMFELKYTFKTDTLFKMLFVKYPELLRRLIAALLRIRYEDIEEFDVRNPEMLPENLQDKFCVLDINMIVNGQRVDLEIQVENRGDYPERALYYWAREYSTALTAGDAYSQLPRTIIISIVDFKMFDCDEFHSEFQALEVTRHTPLNDKMSLYFFELPKLPKAVAADNDLLLWLALFNAQTEDDLKKIEELEVPIMKEAIGAYRAITVSDEFREAERQWERARHNEASALLSVRRDERATIAKNLLSVGDSIDKIAKATNLPYAEIEKLRTQL